MHMSAVGQASCFALLTSKPCSQTIILSVEMRKRGIPAECQARMPCRGSPLSQSQAPGAPASNWRPLPPSATQQAASRRSRRGHALILPQPLQGRPRRAPYSSLGPEALAWSRALTRRRQPRFLPSPTHTHQQSMTQPFSAGSRERHHSASLCPVYKTSRSSPKSGAREPAPR